MSEFFAMGGYAAYVWTAYGAAAIGLAGLGLSSWRRMRALEQKAERLRAARRADSALDAQAYGSANTVTGGRP